MTLPVLVDLQACETQTSFVSRLAAANMSKSATRFSTDMSLSFLDLVRGKPRDLSRLAELGEVDCEALLRHAIRSVEGGGHVLADQAFEKKTLLRSNLRVCPACILADYDSGGEFAPFDRSYWHVGGLRTCTRHHCTLLSTSELAKDRSPHDFFGRLMEVAPRGRLAGSSSTAAEPTGLEHYIVARIHVGATHNWLNKFGLQVVIKTSEMLGAVLRSGANVDLLALDEREWAASGGAGFSVLSAGEAAFRESLRDLQRRHGGSTGGPQAHFGRFYQWLYSGAKAKQYDRVRDIVHDHITSSYPIATGTVVLGKPCVRRRVHSVASAAKEAGLHPKRLRSILEAEGFLQSPSGASRNDGEYLFDAELVRPLLINTSMSVCQGRAQRELGISRSQFDVMRKWGFVAPVSETAKAKPRYSVLAIREFRKKILRHAETVAVPEAGQSDLQTAARKVVCSTGEIVTLILGNQLEFVGCLPRQRNFGGLLVDVEEVRAKLAIPPDDGLTKPELQKRLHASYAMVKWLCDEGYLSLERSRSSVSRKSQMIARRECVEAFCKSYTTLGFLMHETGRAATAIRTQLERRGVFPVLPDHPLGRRLYRQSDLRGCSSFAPTG